MKEDYVVRDTMDRDVLASMDIDSVVSIACGSSAPDEMKHSALVEIAKRRAYSSINANLLVRIVNGDGFTDQQKKDALEEIIRQNDRLVISIIRKSFSSYQHSYMDDMLQEGRLAIFTNAPRFDPERGTISTFLVPYITDAIKTYISSVMGISTHYAAQIKKQNRAIAALQRKGIENPTNMQVAMEMGVGITAVYHTAMQSLAMNPVSLEGDGKDANLCSPYSSSPEALYEAQETKERISAALSRLPKNMRQVIYYSFFADPAGKELPLNEVAKRMDITVSDARRLKNLALRRLSCSQELGHFNTSRARHELENYADSIEIEFMLPEDTVSAQIDIALSCDDDCFEPCA